MVRFRVVLFASVVFGLLFFAFLTYIMPRAFSSSTEYVGVTGRYRTDELPVSILSLVGEGLTKISEDGSVVPGLAESWETSEDGKVWTFHLALGRSWHDKSPVTASTIQYSYEDTTIERPDEKTVRFILNSPFSPFAAVVSRPTFKRGLLGTGEWKVTAVKLASQYVERITLKNDKNQKRIIRFFPTEEGTKNAYMLGEIDTIADAIDPAPFDSWVNSEIYEHVRRDRIVAVFFNNEAEAFKGPGNKPLRQALSYAIEKNQFKGPRALGPISPESWAYNPLVKDYAYDLERARELVKDISGVEINLTTTPSLLPVAETIANSWKEIGVTTNVQVVSVLPEDFQAFLAIYDIPRDPDQYAFWHTTQTSTNISNYSNPRIDKLLEDGRVTLNQEERKKIYLDFQRFLLEDAPAVFLYHPISFEIHRK